MKQMHTIVNNRMPTTVIVNPSFIDFSSSIVCYKPLPRLFPRLYSIQTDYASDRIASAAASAASKWALNLLSAMTAWMLPRSSVLDMASNIFWTSFRNASLLLAKMSRWFSILFSRIAAKCAKAASKAASSGLYMWCQSCTWVAGSPFLARFGKNSGTDIAAVFLPEFDTYIIITCLRSLRYLATSRVSRQLVMRNRRALHVMTAALGGTARGFSGSSGTKQWVM